MGALQVNANDGYELRFESLSVAHRWFSFACNAQGAADLNQLSDRARCNYLFARALVGREVAAPAVALDIVQ